MPAEPLLASGDPGLRLWVPLARFGGPPEPMLQRCREVIEREEDPDERSTLLALAQVTIFGGRSAMIESRYCRN